MAQAKRKSAKRGQPGRRSWSGLGMLMAGALIGALAMQLWHAGGAQRMRGAWSMFDSPLPTEPEPPAAASDNPPAKPVTDFTFFTILPEIEVAAPTPPTPPQPKPAPVADTTAAVKTDTAPVRDASPAAAPASQFMLQAGSYRSAAEADRLKATLGLRGLKSTIQKVTIQGRGDFYRVRLGPFPTYRAMVEVDRQLSAADIKALRLKMKGG